MYSASPKARLEAVASVNWHFQLGGRVERPLKQRVELDQQPAEAALGPVPVSLTLSGKGA